MEAKGRADYGINETIASSKYATNCVLSAIGNFSKIQPVKIQVAVRDNSHAKRFKLSKTWTVRQCIVLCLTTGPPALVNITFLFHDDVFAAEDVLLILPLLKHLVISTTKMLEKHHGNLDSADCYDIQPNDSDRKMGVVGRLMIERLKHLHGYEPKNVTSNDQTCYV